MCNEAIEKGETIKNDPARQFVRSIGWHLVAIRAQLSSALGDKPEPPVVR